jgi:hypothetical protein
MSSGEHDAGISQMPGFPALAAGLQDLVRAAEAGDTSERALLLERVADVLNVFIGLDLLQFVFMPTDEPAPVSGGIEIDLIAPDEEDSAAIAWFSIDEAGYDEYRDAVTMFGDIADVLNPPIVLDVNDDEEEALTPED